MDDWKPTSSIPTKPGTRIKALVETELVMDEWSPATLSGGWRRVCVNDRIVGWQPLPTPPDTPSSPERDQ